VTGTLTLQVIRRTEEAAGIIGLTLSDPHGTSLPAWEPGAHVALHLDRAGEAAVIRQYSLCGSPTDSRTYRVAVLREGDGLGSALIHQSARPGSLLRVSPPRNQFPFSARERVVFVAGGIGITPILPMVAAAADAGVDWTLHYAGRSRAARAFADELVVHGDRVRTYDSADGRRMSVTEVVAGAAGAVIYACGPARLLDDLQVAADAAGVPLSVERFRSEAAQPVDGDRPFEVELSPSGRTITIPVGRSILDRLAEEGIHVTSSCRSGTCGTCETFVVTGEPDHRDAILTPQERAESEVMMICVSRCRGDRLVLEM
jgi:ferredoxin-NADP reductase